jgi:hypothetical protein
MQSVANCECSYEYLEKTWNVGIISCAACVHPPVYMKDGKFWMEEGLAELTKDKIRAILSIAAFHVTFYFLYEFYSLTIEFRIMTLLYCLHSDVVHFGIDLLVL